MHTGLSCSLSVFPRRPTIFPKKTAKKFEKMLDKLFFSAIIVKVAKDSRWLRP